MLGHVSGLTKHIAQALGKTRSAIGLRRSGRGDLCSLEEYERTFRDLFLTVEDGDPLYLHKRGKGGQTPSRD